MANMVGGEGCQETDVGETQELKDPVSEKLLKT